MIIHVNIASLLKWHIFIFKHIFISWSYIHIQTHRTLKYLDFLSTTSSQEMNMNIFPPGNGISS